jgi:hypothetical protein
MKITIESTSKMVTLESPTGTLPARIWQGETEGGIHVQVFITRIAPEIPQSHPEIEVLTAEFEQDLKRCTDPRQTVEAIPFRFFID